MKNIIIFSLGLALPFIIGATAARIFTFSDGNILTAAQLNGEFDNLISTVNNLDENNIAASTQFLPANISPSIAGTNVDRDPGSGQLSVEFKPFRQRDVTPSAARTISESLAFTNTVLAGNTQVLTTLELTTLGNAVLLKNIALAPTTLAQFHISCLLQTSGRVDWEVRRNGSVISTYFITNITGVAVYKEPVLPDVIDFPPAGTHTYEVRTTTNANVGCGYESFTTYAWEL